MIKINSKLSFNSYLKIEGNQKFANNLQNFAASANFSGENLPLLTSISGDRSKILYQGWVRNWKHKYAELTERVRFLKRSLKKAEFEKLKDFTNSKYDTDTYEDRVLTRSYISEIRQSLDILRETAQIMLNARRNARILNQHFNVKK